VVHCGARLQMPRDCGRLNRLESRRGFCPAGLGMGIHFPGNYWLLFIIRISDALILKQNCIVEKGEHTLIFMRACTASQDRNAASAKGRSQEESKQGTLS
jgi:hypothetical protein